MQHHRFTSPVFKSRLHINNLLNQIHDYISEDLWGHLKNPVHAEHIYIFIYDIEMYYVTSAVVDVVFRLPASSTTNSQQQSGFVCSSNWLLNGAWFGKELQTTWRPSPPPASSSSLLLQPPVSSSSLLPPPPASSSAQLSPVLPSPVKPSPPQPSQTQSSPAQSNSVLPSPVEPSPPQPSWAHTSPAQLSPAGCSAYSMEAIKSIRVGLRVGDEQSSLWWGIIWYDKIWYYIMW